MNSVVQSEQSHPVKKRRYAAPQTIAIVRALPGLGDFLCLVPALRALRNAFPYTKVTLIGLPEACSWVERFNDYLHNWIEFPGFPGIPEVPFQASRTAEAIERLRRLRFDWTLQLHGDGSYINSFTQMLGARMSAGFFPVGQLCPDPSCFFPYPQEVSEVWRSLRLLELLGVPLAGDDLEFPLHRADWQEWESVAARYRLPQNYVCIHPGASRSEKCWSPDDFAIVADALANQGLAIVLTGTGAESSLTQAVAKKMQSSAIDLAGQTQLGGMAALLKKSRLLICNDTGVSHLAAAVKTPSVVIFSNTDSQRWAPLNRQRHRVVSLMSDRLDVARVIEEGLDLLLQQEGIYAS